MGKNYIETLIGSLTSNELSTLKGQLSKKAPTLDIKFKNLNVNAKGINYTLFREGFFNKRLGILVYNDNYCSFLEYNGCLIKPYEINVEKHTSSVVECCEITKTDLLRMVDDYLSGGSTIEAESIFASEEIEFSEEDGDFGTNAKARIKEMGLSYVTIAPTSANTDGLKIAYLTSEPATKHDGWIYLIKE